MKKLLLILFLLLIPAFSACAETLTLNTYYPAPFGSYDRLRLVPRGIPPFAVAPCDEGTLLYDEVGHAVMMCDENGLWVYLRSTWTQLGDAVYLTDSTNLNIAVGIGTTTPTNKLDVAGSSVGLKGIVTGSIYLGKYEDAGGGVSSDGWIKYYSGPNPAYLGFPLGGNDIVIMPPAAGGVGIGTLNPMGKLDVNGSIFQRGAQLHADYVFEPGYDLPTIEESAGFMRDEKHLMAISPTQHDEDGNEVVELGARNRGIVEELEKAHIYINQLNGRIKALESSIEEINNR